jgi:membrane-bound lytic murein transglycosylase A
MKRRAVLSPALMLAAFAALGACASNPTTSPRPGIARPGPAKPVTPPPAPFALTAASFADIPGWAQADMAPALLAFRRQCASWRRRAPTAMTSGGKYGGPVGDWFPACDAAETIQPGQERWFFESYFQPSLVSGAGEQRLTSYFEPVIEARRALEPGYTEPLLRRPNDMLTVDLGAFADAYDSDALRGAPRSLTGKLVGDRIEPYPKRGAITAAPDQIIAWANPADVYNLQVQGSGRMRFPDGSEARAQFAAQNGYKWNSALGALRSAGRLATATWAGFRQYLDANPSETTPTLNADPSYVFFQEETISDFTAGPKGAAGVPLTAMGSLAVDPAYHPYGAVIFVDGVYDGYAFQRLMVAQDTGGAIRRGPQRGDVFAGSGPEAGAFAEKMNGPARWWTLLPIKFSNAPIASNAPAAAHAG